MVDLRHERAVYVDRRVGRCRAADNQEPREAWRASHTGQALDRTQRITARAWDAVDFTAFDGAASHFTGRALTLHGDFHALGHGRQAVRGFGFFPDPDLFLI